MAKFRSGFVAMLGRTNVGKSTLLNMLVGEKVAATANKVQTTRTAIKGIVNKIDLVKREKLLHLIDIYQKEYNFEAVIPISSLKEKYRDIILDEIEKNLKIGPAYYNIEEYTDQTLRQLAEETIREKALRSLDDEVPHGIAVEVVSMKKRDNKELYDIEATIYCEKKSHKGIIIGKDGAMLRKIGERAREDIEEMLQCKVNLQLWVKVKEDWRDNINKMNQVFH